MKFILTVNGTLINFDEVSKIHYESSDNIWFSYFVLKSGEKFVLGDNIVYFEIKSNIYHFDAWCHKTYNMILLSAILESRGAIVCIKSLEAELWHRFKSFCRAHMSELTKEIKPEVIF